MKSRKLNTGLAFGLLALSAVQHAVALDCKSYAIVSTQLDEKYAEQRIFSGFADAEAGAGAAAIYEFWGNPKRGNWSLVAQKLFLFKHEDGATFTKNCTFIVKSGKQHQVLRQPVIVATEATQATGIGVAAEMSAPPPSSSVVDTATAQAVPDPAPINCISHSRHAQALKERYYEVPVVQALTDDKTLVEVYASDSSWTIIQAKVREVRNTLTGAPLTDSTTGQQVHQLCSDPAYSGMTWSLSEIVSRDDLI